MKKEATYEEFKSAMKKAGIKVSKSVYSEFIGVKLKTEQGCQLNGTIMTKEFRDKYQAEIGFINAYRDNFSVFDGLMRVVF